mgnify:CR=1 FL=1
MCLHIRQMPYTPKEDDMCRKSSEDSQVSKDNSNVSLGLDFDQRWQIIQHFTEWIKHGDSKIQMLLTVQGVIVAAYGAFVAGFIPKGSIWNCGTIIASVLFALATFLTFIYGFFVALQPYTKPYKEDDKRRNVFFYGSYQKDEQLAELEILDDKDQLKQLSRQISVLGGTAKEKFHSVKILQIFVMISFVAMVLVFVSFSFVG